MGQSELSNLDLQVLDIITNFEPLPKFQLSGFWASKDKQLTDDDINSALNKLKMLKLIRVTKDQYGREVLSINLNSRKKVFDLLEHFWKSREISKEKLLGIAQRNDSNIMRFLELTHVYEDKAHVSFSDYYWDPPSHDLCVKLLEIGMVFKATWSSRKHYYEEYYLRKIPVDVKKTLQEYILGKINVENLKLDPDWRILLILIFTEEPVRISDIKENFPALTFDEFVEILAKLEERSALTLDTEEVRLSRATRDIICLLYTSPSPRDLSTSRMPSSA